MQMRRSCTQAPNRHGFVLYGSGHSRLLGSTATHFLPCPAATDPFVPLPPSRLTIIWHIETYLCLTSATAPRHGIRDYRNTPGYDLSHQKEANAGVQEGARIKPQPRRENSQTACIQSGKPRRDSAVSKHSPANSTAQQ